MRLGLEGESIPLHARIVCVADAFDAMTSGRTYQPAISTEEAQAELVRCAGSHFDPRCVEALLHAFDKLDDSRWTVAHETSVAYVGGPTGWLDDHLF